MQCASCGADVSAGMSFCGKCGAKVEIAGEGKGPAEVTGEWMKTLLESVGFSVELDESSADKLVATHGQRPNQIVQIRRDLGIVSMQSPWSLKKRRWGGKEPLLEAVNSANSSSWYSTFYANLDDDRLTASCYLQLTERLNGADVLGQLERVEEDFFRALKGSGLTEHLA